MTSMLFERPTTLKYVGLILAISMAFVIVLNLATIQHIILHIISAVICACSLGAVVLSER